MFNFLSKYYPVFFQGTGITIIISLIGISLGILIGLLVVICNRSNVFFLELISKIYIAVVRGTPAMIQVMLIYYIVSLFINIPGVQILGSGLDRIIPGAVALGMNSGAYTAEIFRSGIISISKGQTEAALSLGLSEKDAFFSIVMPQAIRNILPALGNEFITMVKESSVLFYIGVQEVTAQALGVGGALYDYIPPLLVAAFIYFILTYILTIIMNYVENFLNKKYSDSY